LPGLPLGEPRVRQRRNDVCANVLPQAHSKVFVSARPATAGSIDASRIRFPHRGHMTLGKVGSGGSGGMKTAIRASVPVMEAANRLLHS